MLAAPMKPPTVIMEEILKKVVLDLLFTKGQEKHLLHMAVGLVITDQKMLPGIYKYDEI